MSIETVLTLGLALAILVAGFVLRLVVLTVLRLGMRLAGRDASWLTPQRVPRSGPLPRPRQGGAFRRAGTAIAAGAAALAAATGPALAAIGRAVAHAAGAAAQAAARSGTALAAALRGGARTAAAAAAALEQWADATNARLAPRTAEVGLAARRSAAAGAKRLRLLLITLIATVQHFASLAATRVRQRPKPRPVPSPETRERRAQRRRDVIDLDRDEDPLSPARPSRPTAGARL